VEQDHEFFPFVVGTTAIHVHGAKNVLINALNKAQAEQILRVLNCAYAYRHCKLEGDTASVLEDSGEQVERSSDSWYDEAHEYQESLFDAIETLAQIN
jgi:hypothetical protein